MTASFIENARKILSYDAETGIFTYCAEVARRVRRGDIAGSINDEGYRNLRINGRTYKAHRLAWLYVHGDWPPGQIDHINGHRSDNRIANLRIATRSNNLANSKVFRVGKSLPKGVTLLSTGRYIARIQKDHRSIFLGGFSTADEAVSAYRIAATELFGPYRRTM